MNFGSLMGELSPTGYFLCGQKVPKEPFKGKGISILPSLRRTDFQPPFGALKIGALSCGG